MQFSFRPPNADYLGFPATPEGIVSTARRAEALGYDAVLVHTPLPATRGCWVWWPLSSGVGTAMQ